MRLLGKYHVCINGQCFTAYNEVSDGGLAVAASLIAGQSAGLSVKLGLTDDGYDEVTDTLDSHPTWQVYAEAQATNLAAAGRTVQTPVVDFVASRDGVIGGCYLVMGDTLFSVAQFEPLGVVTGDRIKAQYELELAR